MANNPSDFTIGADDERGMNPPTGNRSPVMPYINRSIYENEFSRAAKIYFLQALLRTGFNVYDVKPESSDVPVHVRSARINREKLTRLVSFGYDSYGSGTVFTDESGFSAAFSPHNPESRAFCEDIAFSLKSCAHLNRCFAASSTGSEILNTVGCASAVVKAGFATNYTEAANMLDPDFAVSVAETAARAVSLNLDVPFVERDNLAAYRTLRRGDRGRAVQLLQYLLLSCDYSIECDGFFGSETESALTEFQRGNCVTSDGVAGRSTYAKLLVCDSDTDTEFRNCENYVKYVQRKLLSKLYPVTPDGILNEVTSENLKRFLRDNNLDESGVIDGTTLSALKTAPPRPRLY